MASATESMACALPLTGKQSFLDKLNTVWHERALRIYTLIVLAHWAEHLVQAFQIYVLHWPVPQSLGVLGMAYPWLVKSEFMHYSYALVMLIGFWILRRGFVGRSYVWWMIAFWIQFWHHIEHALLQGQVIYGANFFGAPAPISIIQMIGFLEGSASSGFNGLMKGPVAGTSTWMLMAVRRVEVHLFYNTIVFIPMVVSMYYHLFPSDQEAARMHCSCIWHKQATEPVPV